MEVMLAIKQLDFKRVAELLSKNPSKDNGESGQDGDTSYQISLIQSAMNTGSIEMLEMVLENARRRSQKGGPKESQNGETTSANGEISNKTHTNKDNFIQNAFNNWKRKISTHHRNPTNGTIPENSTTGASSDVNNNNSQTIHEETNGVEQGACEGGEEGKRTTPRRKQSCPTGLDEKYYINQNRRHCTWYDEENPEDVANFQKYKQQAYKDEVMKAEELLKTMKTKRKRKHSVGKSLYGKNGS